MLVTFITTGVFAAGALAAARKPYTAQDLDKFLRPWDPSSMFLKPTETILLGGDGGTGVIDRRVWSEIKTDLGWNLPVLPVLRQDDQDDLDDLTDWSPDAAERQAEEEGEQIVLQPDMDVHHHHRRGRDKLAKRYGGSDDSRCATTQIVYIDRTDRFTGWDIQMGQVAKAPLVSPVTVGVSTTVTIGNSITVTGGVDLKLIKDFLSASGSVSIGRTWSTAQMVSWTSSVPPGFKGVFVTNPFTVRKWGSIRQGCPGHSRVLGTFVIDEFQDQVWSPPVKKKVMDTPQTLWIAGEVTVCMKSIKELRGMPLDRCVGSGLFI